VNALAQPASTDPTEALHHGIAESSNHFVRRNGGIGFASDDAMIRGRVRMTIAAL